MPAPVTPIVSILRLVGFAEGLSCLALFGVAMPLKYAAEMPLAVRIVGGVHGALFLAFLGVLALAMIQRRWALHRGVLAAVAAVVPFGTFVIDRRLREWDEDPSGALAAYRRVGDALGEIPAWIARVGLVAPAVSAWPIGQHLDQALRAQAGIAARLDGSAPAEAAPPARWLGRVLLALGWIPRGRGKAPAATLPQPADAGALQAAFAAALASHAALAAQLPTLVGDPSRTAHPTFGGLTRTQWLRLAPIHLRHHLRIVRDIARQA